MVDVTSEMDCLALVCPTVMSTEEERKGIGTRDIQVKQIGQMNSGPLGRRNSGGYFQMKIPFSGEPG